MLLASLSASPPPPRPSPGHQLPAPRYMLQLKQDFSCQLDAFTVHAFHNHEVALGRERGDCHCEEVALCPGDSGCCWQPNPLSRPCPSPQAHLIIRGLGEDLELALGGEQGAVIGASLRGPRAEGQSAHGPHGRLALPLAGVLLFSTPLPLLLVPRHEILPFTFFFLKYGFTHTIFSL